MAVELKGEAAAKVEVGFDIPPLVAILVAESIGKTIVGERESGASVGESEFRGVRIGGGIGSRQLRQFVTDGCVCG